MQVKEVVAECLIKLGKENFVSKEEYTDEENAIAERLVAALNIAYQEAVTEYLPLVKEEEVAVSDGTIDVSALTERIIYPVSLVAGGAKYPLCVQPDRLLADYKGKAVLKYAYLPAEYAFGDTIDDMRITPSVLADGTLAEYCFQDKVFDLAKSYDTDFRSALGLLRYKGRVMRLKTGRWRA